MGSSAWVVNPSPLILLGKAQHLDLLIALADTVVIPQAVATEVAAKPDRAAILTELTATTACCITADETARPDVLACDLGAGESQVITHALLHGADRVVLDDLEARRCAKAMGLEDHWHPRRCRLRHSHGQDRAGGTGDRAPAPDRALCLE